MIHVHAEPQYNNWIQAEVLQKAATFTLMHENYDPQAELTIVIDSNERLQQLNRDFLGIDAPTDVLSFPSDEFDPDDQAQYVGDIIISFPLAEKQARAAGHPVINEIQLLVVHGTLHLLGHDHATESEKKVMWSAQAEILAELDCQINQFPE